MEGRRTKSLPPVVGKRLHDSIQARVFWNVSHLVYDIFALLLLYQQFPVTEVSSTNNSQLRKQTAFVQLGLLHPRSVFVSIVISKLLTDGSLPLLICPFIPLKRICVCSCFCFKGLSTLPNFDEDSQLLQQASVSLVSSYDIVCNYWPIYGWILTNKHSGRSFLHLCLRFLNSQRLREE